MYSRMEKANVLKNATENKLKIGCIGLFALGVEPGREGLEGTLMKRVGFLQYLYLHAVECTLDTFILYTCTVQSDTVS